MTQYDVLLVEDNESDEALSRTAMRKMHPSPEVRVARDGQQAWELLTSVDERPQVVLLDLKLPRISGFEILERLLEHPAAPRVVVVSSSDVEHDIARCRELGAIGFLTKPMEYRDYLAAVQAAVRFGLQNESADVAGLRAFVS